ncbi:MAG: hypothetical protein ACQESF_00790 [Nanobdellota archaeon]
MGELYFRVKEFFRFSKREKRDILLAVLVVTFAFALNDGREKFNAVLWFGNLLQSLFFVTLALLAHVSVQKIFALQQGFTSEFRAWSTGLLVTIAVSLISLGKFYILLPGGMVLYHMTILRIGKFRYGENVVARGMIAVSGAIANLVLATIGLMFSHQLNILPGFFLDFAMVNLWIMFFTILPIPYMDGIHLFFMSRLTYVFIVSTLLAYVILSALGIFSWLFSLVIGIVVWFLYYSYIE